MRCKCYQISFFLGPTRRAEGTTPRATDTEKPVYRLGTDDSVRIIAATFFSFTHVLSQCFSFSLHSFVLYHLPEK